MQKRDCPISWGKELMNDIELKNLLLGSIEEPDQMKKDRFLRSIRRDLSDKNLGFTDMLITQSRFIRKRVWIVSLMIFGLALVGSLVSNEPLIPVLADLMPLLAALGMIESFRAVACGMSELESVTLYSGRGSLFAKMTAIGILQLITVLSLALMIGKGADGILNAGLSMIIPYLFTTIVCMELERTSFGRDNLWSHFGVAALIITIRELLRNVGVIPELGIGLSSLLALFLIAIQIYEIRKTFRSEALAWNLK